MRPQRWIKSSFSGNSGNCVEVLFADGTAQVRDSKRPDGPALLFTRSEWEAFELGVVNGEFSMPL